MCVCVCVCVRVRERERECERALVGGRETTTGFTLVQAMACSDLEPAGSTARFEEERDRLTEREGQREIGACSAEEPVSSFSRTAAAAASRRHRTQRPPRAPFRLVVVAGPLVPGLLAIRLCTFDSRSTRRNMPPTIHSNQMYSRFYKGCVTSLQSLYSAIMFQLLFVNCSCAPPYLKIDRSRNCHRFGSCTDLDRCKRICQQQFVCRGCVLYEWFIWHIYHIKI